MQNSEGVSMKKEKEKEKIKKTKYLKPVLTKQKKLKDMTGVYDVGSNLYS